jgi:hypothetical protein
LRPLVVALVPGQQQLLDQLKEKRLHLSNEVAELINEYGPKMYQNFDEVSKLDSMLETWSSTVSCMIVAYLGSVR